MPFSPVLRQLGERFWRGIDCAPPRPTGAPRAAPGQGARTGRPCLSQAPRGLSRAAGKAATAACGPRPKTFMIDPAGAVGVREDGDHDHADLCRRAGGPRRPHCRRRGGGGGVDRRPSGILRRRGLGPLRRRGQAGPAGEVRRHSGRAHPADQQPHRAGAGRRRAGGCGGRPAGGVRPCDRPRPRGACADRPDLCGRRRARRHAGDPHPEDRSGHSLRL